MRKTKLLRGCIILLALSITLIYLNRELEQTHHMLTKTAVQPRQKKPEKKKNVVIAVQVVTQKPKPEKVKKTKETSPAKKPETTSGNDPKNGDKDPAVLATYKMNVETYLDFMLQQGARAGLYDNNAGKFICNIDRKGTMGGRIKQNGMSTRARRITTDFPNSRTILRNAALKYGPARYEILLLIPKRMDDRFYRNVNKIISRTGRNVQDISLVRVTYEGTRNTIRVKVNSLEGKGGTSTISENFYM